MSRQLDFNVGKHPMASITAPVGNRSNKSIDDALGFVSIIIILLLFLFFVAEAPV